MLKTVPRRLKHSSPSSPVASRNNKNDNRGTPVRRKMSATNRLPLLVWILSIVVLLRIGWLLVDDEHTARISFETLTGGGGKDGVFPSMMPQPNAAVPDDGLDWSYWNDATMAGIHLTRIHGDPQKCKDVIYTADTRTPLLLHGMKEDSFVLATWEALTHIVQLSPAMNQTCLAYIRISQPFRDPQSHQEMHPVWGRLPATALVMQFFRNADYFLYMDTDATLALPSYTPTDMYQALAYDGYGQNATFQHKTPGLIVNKPFTGWLCGQCESYGLGHGCFNSGVLLWRRSKEAFEVLQTWWESRSDNATQNFVRKVTAENGNEIYQESFHGWSSPSNPDTEEKMSEQNRLMYIYGTYPAMKKAIWPVPQQLSEEFQSASCPNELDEEHTPCLQKDNALDANWNDTTNPTCFVNHYADEKSQAVEVMKLIEASYKAAD